MDIIIKGKRVDRECVVVIKSDHIAAPLDPHDDLVNHSSNGFEWGYSGSGPSQLAFAIMFEYGKSKFPKEIDAYKFAITYYMKFRDDYIASVQEPSFEISFDQIERWVDGESQPSKVEGSEDERVET